LLIHPHDRRYLNSPLHAKTEKKYNFLFVYFHMSFFFRNFAADFDKKVKKYVCIRANTNHDNRQVKQPQVGSAHGVGQDLSSGAYYQT
jgi:hypothetical protein